jgi:hypothetical protein
MKKMPTGVAAIAALLLTTLNGRPATKGNTVVDIAAGADQFKTLVAASEAAGLVETRKRGKSD